MPRLMNIIYAAAVIVVGSFALQGVDPKEGHLVYADSAAKSDANAKAVLGIAKARSA
jgi:hypothetical protein